MLQLSQNTFKLIYLKCKQSFLSFSVGSLHFSIVALTKRCRGKTSNQSIPTRRFAQLLLLTVGGGVCASGVSGHHHMVAMAAFKFFIVLPSSANTAIVNTERTHANKAVLSV